MPPRGLGEHDLVARRLVLGLLVDAPADLDVEHVDLAVARACSSPSGPTWIDVLRPRSSPSTRSLNEPATRSIPSSRRSPSPTRRIGPSNGSAAAIVCSGVPSAGHFSGSTTSSAPACAASRVRRSAVARLRSRSGVDCSWTAAARTRFSFPDGLTRQSIASMSISFRAHAAAQVLALGRRVRTGRDAVRRHARRSACSARSWWAVWDGTRLREGTRGVTLTRERRAGRDGDVRIGLTLAHGDADRGHHRTGLDAQDAAAP